jgi:hypothetical protein
MIASCMEESTNHQAITIEGRIIRWPHMECDVYVIVLDCFPRLHTTFLCFLVRCLICFLVVRCLCHAHVQLMYLAIAIHRFQLQRCVMAVEYMTCLLTTERHRWLSSNFCNVIQGRLHRLPPLRIVTKQLAYSAHNIFILTYFSHCATWTTVHSLTCDQLAFSLTFILLSEAERYRSERRQLVRNSTSPSQTRQRRNPPDVRVHMLWASLLNWSCHRILCLQVAAVVDRLHANVVEIP